MSQPKSLEDVPPPVRTDRTAGPTSTDVHAETVAIRKGLGTDAVTIATPRLTETDGFFVALLRRG